MVNITSRNAPGNSAMQRTLVLLILCFIVLSMSAVAQASMIERRIKGKTDANINAGIFVTVKRDCTAGPLPAVRLLTPPAHGKVTLKQGRIRATNLKQCLGIDLPAFVAFYRSTRGFVGQDNFIIEVTGADGKVQVQRITVTVTGSGAGESL